MNPLPFILIPFLIFNPILLTLVAVAAGLWALRFIRFHPFRRQILIGLAAVLAIYFLVDSSFAYRRVSYARQIPTTFVTHRRISPPSSLVLVGISCDLACLHRLADRGVNEVIVLDESQLYLKKSQSPLRYRIGRDASVCPTKDEDFCPTADESAIPSEGTFVVRERTLAVRERAKDFSPQYVVAHPPSAVIQFSAVEVQQRSSAGTEVLAEAVHYEAAGYLGPLIGCWERPDNIIWIMPVGDSGCGFWRRLAYGVTGRIQMTRPGCFPMC
jgi:hypothetical protein